MHHLALQIAQFHRVVVGQRDVADTGTGQIQRHRRAQPASTNHQYPRCSQPLLAFDIDFRQQDMPAIAQQRRIVQICHEGEA